MYLSPRSNGIIFDMKIYKRGKKIVDEFWACPDFMLADTEQ